jgi:hypothetical protein
MMNKTVGYILFKRRTIEDYMTDEGWEGTLDLHDQGLDSLQGSPITIIDGNFNVSANNLYSLKYGPESVYGEYDCGYNNLQSLEFGPNNCHSLDATSNSITHLRDIHKIIEFCSSIYVKDNPITSHILGLVLIEALMFVTLSNDVVGHIVNHHLNTDRDIYLCQDNLIKAGFAEYAQL